jgi:hypothetical protein
MQHASTSGVPSGGLGGCTGTALQTPRGRVLTEDFRARMTQALGDLRRAQRVLASAIGSLPSAMRGLARRPCTGAHAAEGQIP